MYEINNCDAFICSTPIHKRKTKTDFQNNLIDYGLSFNENTENNLYNNESQSKIRIDRSEGGENKENGTKKQWKKIDIIDRFSGASSTPNYTEIEKQRRQTISDIDYSVILHDRSNYLNKSLSKLRIDESEKSISLGNFIDYKQLFANASLGGGLTQSMRYINPIEISNNAHSVNDSDDDLESIIDLEDEEKLERLVSREESKSLNHDTNNSRVNSYRNVSGSINRSDWNKYRNTTVSNSSGSREVLSALSSVKSTDLISNNANNKFIDNFTRYHDGVNRLQSNYSKHSGGDLLFGGFDQETTDNYRHKTSRNTETDNCYYSRKCVDRINNHNTSSDYITSKSYKSLAKTIEEVDSDRDCVANMDFNDDILHSLSNKQKIIDDYYGRKQRITRDNSDIEQSEGSLRTDRSKRFSILNLTSDKSEKDGHSIDTSGSMDHSVCQKVLKLLRENAKLRKIINCLKNTNVLTADRMAEVEEQVNKSHSQMENLIEIINQTFTNYEAERKSEINVKERYINVIVGQCEIFIDQLYPLLKKVLSKLDQNDL